MNYAINSKDNIKEEMCACFVSEMMSDYTFDDFNNLPNYESKKVSMEYLQTCGSKTENLPDYVEPQIIDESNENNEVEPSQINIIGRWRADNCYFNLNYDGKISIEWDEGGVTNGTWKIRNGNLICSYFNQEITYKFLEYKSRRMKYQDVRGGVVYSANRKI